MAAQGPDDVGRGYSRTARLVLVAFLFTFMATRVLIFLIMARHIPDIYIHVFGAHVHHLNIGIILLSLAGGWLLLRRPGGREFSWAAVAYGIGLALTFDEFGMWLRLGGDYWQRTSFDAVVIILALLALIAFAPALKRFRPRHWTTAVLLALALAAFAYALVASYRYAGRRFGPAIHRVEENSPN